MEALSPTRMAVVVYDAGWYGGRHLAGRYIGKAKRCWRVFARFEQLRRRYLGLRHFAAARIRLR